MSSSGVSLHQYSIDELLNLRESLPIIRCVINKISKTEIRSVLRVPEEALHDPDHFICSTKALSEISNRYKISPYGKKYNMESSEESEYQSATITVTDSHAAQPQIHWNLRRRESSDRSSEPHSAPSGIAAQKAENFQKFYRAVISPTHIRVTAGGRIVPNNRSTGPPGTERDNNTIHSDETIALEAAPPSFQTRSWPYPQHLPAGCSKLVPTGIWPASNFPQPSSSFVFPPLAPHLQVYPADKFNPVGRCRALNLDGNIVFGSQPTTLPESIKISHPSQFDHTKPFMINGQVVYPVQPSFQPGFQPSPYAFPVPVGMIGNTNFISQGQLPGFHKPHPTGPPGNSICQVPLPNVQSHSLNPSQSGFSSDFVAPPNFVPSVGIPIPVTDFLTGQLQALYNNLSSIEKQIAGNNSQYDHNILETQRNMIRSEINSVKNDLLNQISRQNSKNLNQDLKDRKLQPVAMPAIISDENKGKPYHKSPPLALAKELESKKPNSTENKNYTDKTTQLKSPFKSRLSISSAKAPPFQPRPQITIDTLTSTENLQKHQSKDFTKTAVKAGSSILESGRFQNVSNSCNGYPTPDLHTLSQAKLRSSNVESIPEQSNGYNFPLNNFNHKLHTSKNLGTPYLIGTVPNDIKSNPNMSTNIVYSRPLTNEEIRARYLYFGKAPRSIQSGLPKFDGKDFYPPSPSKNIEHFNSSKSDFENMTQYGSIAPNFEQKCRALTIPEFLTPSPIRYRHSLQNLQRVSRPLELSFNNNESQSPPSCSSKQGELANQQENSSKINNSGSNEINSPNKFAPSVRNHNTPRLNPFSPENSMDDVAVENFSGIFNEYRASSHVYPLTKRHNSNNINFDNQHDLPVISPKPRSVEDHIDRKNNDQQSAYNEQAFHDSSLKSPYSGMTEDHSTDSTVEIRLSPRFRATSTKLPEEKFAERVENFRSADQQSLFLQNMLKNPPLVPFVGSALSGTITSATAQGYLPQYRGSAVASLAPTRLSPHTTDVSDFGAEHTINTKTEGHSKSSSSPTNTPKSRKDNFTLKSSEISEHVNLVEGLGMGDDERPVMQKDDIKK